MSDLSQSTSQELFENLRETLRSLENHSSFDGSDDLKALDELEARLIAASQEPEVFVLPVSVTEAIRSHFGGGSRTFGAMTKRVRFSYKVWQGKYGPWTPEQAEYAEELCLWAINQASHAEGPGHARARVYTTFDRLLNHEATDAGFKRREGEQLDITGELGELLS